jgi:hypothetical protein
LRAVAVEVADQLRVVAEPGALVAGHVVAPLVEVRTHQVGHADLDLPLMGLGEGQQVAVGQARPLVLLVGEGPRVAVVAVGDDDDLLGPADRVEAPIAQIIGDRAQPTLLAVAELLLPHASRVREPQRGRVDMVHADRPESPAVRCDEPPPAVALRYRKEPGHRLRPAPIDGTGERQGGASSSQCLQGVAASHGPSLALLHPPHGPASWVNRTGVFPACSRHHNFAGGDRHALPPGPGPAEARSAADEVQR